MRSTKLTAALAAAATMLAVAASGAAAAPHHGHPQLTAGHHCSLSIFAEPHAITVGETVEVFGQLNCGVRNAVGQTATLYQRTPGSPLKIVGTTSTVGGGFYSFVEPSLRHQQHVLRACGRPAQRRSPGQGRTRGHVERTGRRLAAAHRQAQRSDLHGHRLAR